MTTVLLIAVGACLVGALARMRGSRATTSTERSSRLVEVLRHDATRLVCAAGMIVLLLLVPARTATTGGTVLFVVAYLAIAAVTAVPARREPDEQPDERPPVSPPTVIRLAPFECDREVLVGAGTQN